MLLCFPENATITIKSHQEIMNSSHFINNRLNFISLTQHLKNPLFQVISPKDVVRNIGIF